MYDFIVFQTKTRVLAQLGCPKLTQDYQEFDFGFVTYTKFSGYTVCWQFIFEFELSKTTQNICNDFYTILRLTFDPRLSLNGFWNGPVL